jgi:regulator of sirC expression with transglutaminase-like and TPR domain
MSQTPTPRQRFDEAINRPDEEVDLAYAALLIAAEEYPDLDIAYYLRELDQMGAAAPRLDTLSPPHQQISRLSAYFVDDLGFTGNRDNYYDPRNSYLNDVIDRRTGIPIALSLVYAEIGRRRGVPLVGVGLPGHFLVGYVTPDDIVLVDAFEGGRVLSETEIASRLAQVFGRPVPVEPEYLRPTGPKAILFRMLNNLKQIYVAADDRQRALAAVERMLVVAPQARQELRDRGLLRARLGQFKAARLDIRDYVESGAAGPDEIPLLREELDRLDRMIAGQN